jgi:hypothetical protein
MFGITSSILNINEFGGEWSSSKPITGIKDVVDDNIQILTSIQMSQSFSPIIPPNITTTDYTFIPQFVLSSQKSIQQDYYSNYLRLSPSNTARTLSPSVNTVEITFSPQNDIDNFIKQPGNLPSFNIGTYIGDPSQTFLPYYPDLQTVATSLLVNNNLKPIEYIRLIKYFDNSLFNMIKDFLPARTNLKSGITIKQHLLERNKIVQPQVFFSSSIYNGLIDTAFIEGGTGGTFNEFNTLTNSFNTQSWYENVKTPLGLTRSLHNDQSEFYNGELPYYPTEAFTADGDLNAANTYKYPSTLIVNYNTYLYTNASGPAGSPVDQLDFTYLQTYAPTTGRINYWGKQVRGGSPVGSIEVLRIHPIDLNGNDYSDVLNNLTSITLIVTNWPIGSVTRTIPVASTYYEQFSGTYTVTPALPYVFAGLSSNPLRTGLVSFIPEPPLEGEAVTIWDYYAYNPIINNTVNDVASSYIMKVNLNDGITVPSNFIQLISGSAERAFVQDSNYSSKAWSNLRYNGSRASSYDFNIPFNVR